MSARTVYFKEDVIRFIERKSKNENRGSFSNALDTIVRKVMEQEGENNG